MDPTTSAPAAGRGHRITLEVLCAEVALVHAGRRAREELDSDAVDPARRDELAAAERDGTAALARLVERCQPFVEHIVQQEMRRRRVWGSRVEHEVLLQEANVGLLRAIRAFNPDAAGTSATNYLGMWMSQEMRRNVETLEHDFAVPFETADRFRKVRAITARLEAQRGITPTSEDVAEASTDVTFGIAVRQAGRKGTGDGARPSTRALTVRQIDEDRQAASRIGAQAARLGAESFLYGTGGGDNQATEVDGVAERLAEAISVDREPLVDNPEESTTEAAARAALAGVLHRTFELLGLPDLQRDIIARFYGLPPHPSEMKARGISRETGVSRHQVGRVLEAFQEEMARPGGTFHATIASIPTDQLHDIGLGWAPAALGPYPPATPAGPVSVVLTRPLSAADDDPPPPPAVPATRGVLAQFTCPFHRRTFSGLYTSPAAVPPARDCPSCGAASPVVPAAAPRTSPPPAAEPPPPSRPPHHPHQQQQVSA